MPDKSDSSKSGSNKTGGGSKIGIFYDKDTNNGGLKYEVKDGFDVHIAGNSNGSAQVGFTSTAKPSGGFPCSIQ